MLLICSIGTMFLKKYWLVQQSSLTISDSFYRRTLIDNSNEYYHFLPIYVFTAINSTSDALFFILNCFNFKYFASSLLFKVLLWFQPTKICLVYFLVSLEMCQIFQNFNKIATSSTKQASHMQFWRGYWIQIFLVSGLTFPLFQQTASKMRHLWVINLNSF